MLRLNALWRGFDGVGGFECLDPVGQLGNGSTTGSAVPVAVSGSLSFMGLAAGSFHTCGFTNAGAAYCWGDNSAGQLGRGTFDYSPVPVAVAPF